MNNKTCTIKQRDFSLDLMRFLGVLVIIFAHTYPPLWLFQVRNFGTPLLIIASALTYATIYDQRSISIYPFYKKRLSRLILPTWIFLVFLFSFFFIISDTLQIPIPFTKKIIAMSFMLSGEFGFVWIFRIYIFLALITPIALKVKKWPISKSTYFLIICGIYVFYEAIYLIEDFYLAGWSKKEMLNSMIFTPIPYTLLYFYGIKLKELSHKTIIIISIVAFILFGTIAIYFFKQTGQFVYTEVYKYPPRIYYLSYSIFAINLIYIACKMVIKHINTSFITWLSTHSLWIYLWHIFAYYLWFIFIDSSQNNELIVSIFKFILFLGFAIIVTHFQTKQVKKHMINSKNKIPAKLAKVLI